MREEGEESENIIEDKGWISFSTSLFVKGRQSTPEEEEIFETYKKEHFKRITLDF